MPDTAVQIIKINQQNLSLTAGFSSLTTRSPCLQMAKCGNHIGGDVPLEGCETSPPHGIKPQRSPPSKVHLLHRSSLSLKPPPRSPLCSSPSMPGLMMMLRSPAKPSGRRDQGGVIDFELRYRGWNRGSESGNASDLSIIRCWWRRRACSSGQVELWR
jgi:hypothetical protein